VRRQNTSECLYTANTYKYIKVLTDPGSKIFDIEFKEGGQKTINNYLK
jgi:hypothetical protein